MWGWSHLRVYHIYTTEDPKDVGGALCGGQPIIHTEVSSNLPMGISIPPFMKAIIEITNEPRGLFMTSHSPNSQCWSSTPLGILYWALKAAMPSEISTNLVNPPMEIYGVGNEESMYKSKWIQTHLQAIEESLLELLLQRKSCKVNKWSKINLNLSLYRGEKWAVKFPFINMGK